MVWWANVFWVLWLCCQQAEEDLFVWIFLSWVPLWFIFVHHVQYTKYSKGLAFSHIMYAIHIGVISKLPFKSNLIYIKCTKIKRIPIFCHEAITIDHVHYSDVIVSAIASQITGVSIVCSTFCSGADQSKHQSSASLAFVRKSTGGSPHKWPITGKMFPFDDVTMFHGKSTLLKTIIFTLWMVLVNAS